MIIRPIIELVMCFRECRFLRISSNEISCGVTSSSKSSLNMIVRPV